MLTPGPCGNHTNPKVATFCAALWLTFTLTLTASLACAALCWYRQIRCDRCSCLRCGRWNLPPRVRRPSRRVGADGCADQDGSSGPVDFAHAAQLPADGRACCILCVAFHHEGPGSCRGRLGRGSPDQSQRLTHRRPHRRKAFSLLCATPTRALTPRPCPVWPLETTSRSQRDATPRSREIGPGDVAYLMTSPRVRVVVRATTRMMKTP